MAATAGQKSRWRRRRPATGGGWRREDDPETTRAEQAIARAKGFGEISKKFPVTIYSPTLSVWPSGTTRWHRDCGIASSYCNLVWPKCSNRLHRDENLDQLSELGLTKMDDSVIPKCTKRFWKFKSMTNRGLRVLLTQSGSNLTWSNFVM